MSNMSMCTVMCMCVQFKFLSNKSYTLMYVLYLTIGLCMKNPKKGTRYYKPPTGRQQWRPGTQALRMIWNAMRTTNLCIPKLLFL